MQRRRHYKEATKCDFAGTWTLRERIIKWKISGMLEKNAKTVAYKLALAESGKLEKIRIPPSF